MGFLQAWCLYQWCILDEEMALRPQGHTRSSGTDRQGLHILDSKFQNSIITPGELLKIVFTVERIKGLKWR